MYAMSQTANNYWEKFGKYVGDFAIRIFWRKQFTRNFNYHEIDGDTDDTTF